MDIRKAKITYWTIGLALIIWMNIVMQTYSSEAAIGPAMFVIIIAFPISLVAQLFSALTAFIIPEGIVASNLHVLFILLMGHFQWFIFFPWFARKFTGSERNNNDKT